MNDKTKEVLQEALEEALEHCVEAARGDVPQGVLGDCDLCGEEGELINGACEGCRQQYNLE